MSKLISLKGATIHFNKNLSDLDWLSDEEFHRFSGTSNIMIINTLVNLFNIMAMKNQIFCFTNENNNIEISYNYEDNAWDYDEIYINDFDYPELNENQSFINWVLSNAEITGGTYANDNIIIKNPLIVNKKSRIYDGTIVVNENE